MGGKVQAVRESPYFSSPLVLGFLFVQASFYLSQRTDMVMQSMFENVVGNGVAGDLTQAHFCGITVLTICLCRRN